MLPPRGNPVGLVLRPISPAGAVYPVANLRPAGQTLNDILQPVVNGVAQQATTAVLQDRATQQAIAQQVAVELANQFRPQVWIVAGSLALIAAIYAYTALAAPPHAAR